MGGLVKHPQCPFCREDVAPADGKAACDRCMAWHHAECWAEHGRCSACGAASALAPGGGAAAADGVPPGDGSPPGDESPAPASAPDLGPIGRLDPAERALAGYLGHPAARDHVPPGAPTLAQGAVDLAGWVAYLAGWGEAVLSRAALAAARQALAAASPPGAEAALAALEDWLSCPCVRHQRLAHAAADAVDTDGSHSTLTAAWAGRAARFAARTAGQRLDLHGPIRAQRAVEHAAAVRALGERGAMEAAPPERAAVRAAISDELLAWLLADRRSSV